jgi:tetratricopeptide (TPR) repeat protein/predicted Ser/Thr protein kinase
LRLISEFDMVQPGEVVGRYRIEAKAGEGSFAVVFRARDVRLDRPVALKILRRTEDKESWGRLLNEGRTASALNHPNICAVFDLGEEDDQQYIAMEYVEGRTLSAALAGGGLPVAVALDYALQMARALAHAHSRRVVHRDLKASNVMVTTEGEVKLLDFGLARRLHPRVIEAATQSRESLAEAGPLAGTLAYMAPEVLHGKAAGTASDIWSLGALLYEMLAGRRPFLGNTPFELSVAIMTQAPDPIAGGLPHGVGPLLHRCLDKDPKLRPSSRELGKQIEAALSGAKARRWRPLLVGGAAVLAAVLLLAAVRARRQPSSQPASGQERAALGIPQLSQGKFVAVLRFTVGGGKASSYVAEGLQEGLSAKLSELQGIHVTSGDSVLRRARGASLDQVARDLGANLVVGGTIQQRGDNVDVIVELHDAATGQPLWSREFLRPAQELLGLEDEIYAELVGALGLSPTDQESVRAGRHPTESSQAYDDYLRGREALRAAQDPESLSRAIEFFNYALQRDRNFALAYAGIADASLVTWEDKKDRFWADKALHAALQARQLDDSLPEVHLSLGSVYSATGKAPQAIAELRRALELAPNSDEAYRRLGGAYLADGQGVEAVRALERAVHLNPYYWLNYNALGEAYYRTGDDSKALAAWLKIRQFEPDNVWGYENVGAVYLAEGEYDRSIPEFQTALRLQPSADLYSNLGTALFYLRRYADAVAMFQKAAEASPNDETISGNLADAYLWSGQFPKAHATYGRAISLAYRELQVDPRNSTTLEHLALYYAHEGEAAQARRYLGRARAIEPQNVDLVYSQAVVETLAGNPRQALNALREALAKGYAVKRANDDPELNPLRESPAFEGLIAEFRGKVNDAR